VNDRLVILGASGFIGSALMEYVTRTALASVSGYRSADLDLTSSDSVERLCRIIDPDTIVVLTARARLTGDPVATFASDVAIATNVARGLAKTGAAKCLYFSTTSVYSDVVTDLAITEETPIAPTSLYGAAKFAGECVLKQVADKAGIPVVILRPCMVYGPGDTSQAYGPARFIQSIRREGRVRLFGDGAEGRDYVFIRDLVAITSQLALGPFVGTYNLATGRSHTFQELVGILREVLSMDLSVEQLERDRPKADQRINLAKLMAVLPDLRLTEFADGLRETCEFFAAKPA